MRWSQPALESARGRVAVGSACNGVGPGLDSARGRVAVGSACNGVGPGLDSARVGWGRVALELEPRAEPATRDGV
ncbi:hypothetical protein Are01nite_39730 [Actinoplanes regularis]|nr:hypothetical protein Are01nite_39730 [Actinoplanes regularis]